MFISQLEDRLQGFFSVFFLLRRAGRDGSDAQRSPTSLDATLSLPDANTCPAAAFLSRRAGVALQESLLLGFFFFF